MCLTSGVKWRSIHFVYNTHTGCVPGGMIFSVILEVEECIKVLNCLNGTNLAVNSQLYNGHNNDIFLNC